MLAALLLGISYGFAAGVSPGPLLGLVIDQTLRRGWWAGNVVALAPLVSDLPIILLAILLIEQLPAAALGWLGIAGGAFVIFLGVSGIRGATARHSQQAAMAAPAARTDASPWRVLGRAVVANLLNPHPYLFWASAGAQLIFRNWVVAGAGGVAGFLLGFYALLVGSKLLVALIASRSRAWLNGNAYRRVLIASGVLMACLGLLLARDGAAALLGG